MVRRRRDYVRPSRLRSLKSLLLLVVVALLAASRWWSEAEPSPPDVLAEGVHQIERVIDGDTFLLASNARVRLIGVDTPETVKHNHPVEPWGPEATAFTKQFLAGGQVRLQFDRERVDHYGRFLAYAWVEDRMLNEELIREGLGTAQTGFPYSAAMKTRFRRAQEEAQEARRAIWSEKP